MEKAYRCPYCPNEGDAHKMSCPNAGKSNAVAEVHGDGNYYKNFRSSGNVGMLFYKGLPSYFDCPLVTHVVGNLYQGGCQRGLTLKDDFGTVVSLYPWERYEFADGTDLYEFKMLDSHDGVEFEDLVKASDAVLNGLAKGHKVLVHCQAGLNRSGLVAAFSLMRQGYTAQEAIDLLRKGRSNFVLSNDTFVAQLHELQHKFELDDEFYLSYSVRSVSNAI